MTGRLTGIAHRLVQSVKRRGVIATIQATYESVVKIAGYAFDGYFDVLHGTETSRIVEISEMTVVGDHKERGVRYQPTRPGAFCKLLSELRIPPGQVFIDVGCGKGRVLMMASNLGFKKIIGVDFAGELCEIAHRNLAVHLRKMVSAPEVAIYCCDAGEYEFSENESVVYMFNPFDAVVLQKALTRLTESLRRTPRKIWFIYHFPRWSEVVESTGLFKRIGYYVFERCEFLVYSYEP